MVVQVPSCQEAIFIFFRAKDMLSHAQRHFGMCCAKMAEPIEIPYGLWTWMGPRKHVLGGLHTGATWRILLNRPCALAMWPFVKFL